MTQEKLTSIVDTLDPDEFKLISYEAVSYSFKIMRDAPMRFGKEWRTELQAVRLLVDEAFIQGYLTAVDKEIEDAKSQGNIQSKAG